MLRPTAGLFRGALLLCTLVPGVLLASSAAAQRTSSLSWVRLEGAEDCIATQTLAERVEQRIGRRVFVSASQADISLEGHVERVSAPSAVVATLVLSDRQGHELGRRVLRVAGSSCEPLEASLVLVIAIAIDPGASLPGVIDGQQQLSQEARAMLEQLDLPEVDARQIEALAVPDAALAAASQPQPAATPAPARPQPAAPAHERAAPQAAGLALRVSGGVALELGVLPEPALGGALAVTIAARGFVPVDVSVTGLLDQEQAIADGRGSGRLQLFAAGLALCPALDATASVLLRVCGGARAGVLTGRGDEFSESYSSSGPWLEAQLAAGAWLRFGRVSLHATAGAGVPLVRDTFRYEDDQRQPHVLHRAAAVTGRFELGAGLHF